MPLNASAQMLQLIANPIRRSIIKSIEGGPISFTEVMRASGLDPNFDTGPFTYHLSVLLDSQIVEKADNKYQLTSFGNTTANIIGSLERESKFLLKIDEVSEGGERMSGKIESRWLGTTDLNGQYGLILGVPLEQALGCWIPLYNPGLGGGDAHRLLDRRHLLLGCSHIEP